MGRPGCWRVGRELGLAQIHSFTGSQFHRRDWGGGGVPLFDPYLQDSRRVNAEKSSSIPGLCAHLTHPLKRAFAAKGSGDPEWDRRCLFRLLDPVYAFAGYWNATERAGWES